MFKSHDLTPPDDEFVTHLRMIRPSLPRLNRDRLMYLAGQRSVTPARQSRPLWPALTIASWTACAVLVGLASARPPRVVTETKIVEHVVEVPVAGVVRPESVPVAPRATADAPLPPASLEPPFDLAFLDHLPRPLTALASRPSLFEESTRPVSVASIEPPAVVEPKKSPTYSELRREWLGTGQRPAFSRPPGWF